MRFLLTKRFSLFFLLSIFIFFISCSKDSEEPVQTEKTIITENLSVTIDENPTNGQLIGTVQGSTNEGSVTFSITEQTPAGAFSIDAASGELKVADESLFDFEINPTITGIVKVSNGSVFENASVTISLNEVNEEHVFNGSIALFTQAEVEAFGSNNYTMIYGTLLIGDIVDHIYSEITDLSSLKTLKYIGGQLNIWRNGELTDLNGLHNIKTVGGDVNIYYNKLLPNLNSLNGLDTLQSGLAIEENDLLENLNGLENLSEIGLDLHIDKNTSLKNIDALINLTNLGGGIKVIDNTILQNINGFKGLTKVNGNILISNNNAILNLEGLQNMTEMSDESSIGIRDNEALISLDGLNNLTSLNGIGLINNGSLNNIDALSNLQNLQGLQIWNNSQLTNIEVFRNITSFEGSLFIGDNEALTTLNGLRNLQSVLGVEIFNNPQLIDLGLESLQSISLHLIIRKNTSLNNLDSLENLQTVQNKLSISDNAVLINFCGLQPLLVNNGLIGDYRVYQNAYNPTKQDIIDGNCSL